MQPHSTTSLNKRSMVQTPSQLSSLHSKTRTVSLKSEFSSDPASRSSSKESVLSSPCASSLRVSAYTLMPSWTRSTPSSKYSRSASTGANASKLPCPCLSLINLRTSSRTSSQTLLNKSKPYSHQQRLIQTMSRRPSRPQWTLSPQKAARTRRQSTSRT